MSGTTPRRAAVLALIAAAAERGGPCPKDRELTEPLGLQVNSLRKMLMALEASGALRVERRSGKQRRFVLADGRATGWTVHDVTFPPEAAAAGLAKRRAVAEEQRARVLAFLEALAAEGAPLPSAPEIGAALALGDTTVWRAIQSLVTRGALRREVNGRMTTALHLTASGGVLRAGPSIAAEAVMAAVVAAVAARQPTPGLDVLGAAAGVSAGRASQILQDLQRAGRLRLEGQGAKRRLVLPDGRGTTPRDGGTMEKARGARAAAANDPSGQARGLRPGERRSPRLRPDEGLSERKAGAARLFLRDRSTLPATADDERAALLARFLAKGGRVTVCPAKHVAPPGLGGPVPSAGIGFL